MDMTSANRGQGQNPAQMNEGDPLWYKDAVIYQLHVKAFFDSNNDGMGDFAGLAIHPATLTRERIALAVAEYRGDDYSIAQHAKSARRAGLGLDEVAHLADDAGPLVACQGPEFMVGVSLDETSTRASDERAPYRGLSAFSPEDAAMFFGREKLVDAFVAETQQAVTGEVRLELSPGRCQPTGRRAERALYRPDLATYESGDAFDHDAGRGFVALWGLPFTLVVLLALPPLRVSPAS